MSESIKVSNIQRFSLQDGPGIRTTVFLKGCSIHCPWCSNPECLESIAGGKEYKAEELVKECLKDKNFYGVYDSLPGGVTFSGGECLLQAKNLVPVMMALKENNVHIAVETSLYAPPEALELMSEYADLLYVDVKIIDPEKCKEHQRADVSLFLGNFESLMRDKTNPVIVRIPVIGQYTDDSGNMDLVYELLNQNRNRILKIELLKEHNLARKKYEEFNLPYEYHGVSDDLMEGYKNKLESLNIPVDILKIL